MVIIILIEICIFSFNEDRTTVHEGTFAKATLILKSYNFQRIVNEWTRLLADCVCASSVNV